MRMKPFLRWAGGKQNLVDDLLDNLPDERLVNRYFEPFLGAGSLFFASKFSNAIISDINSQLINSYISIQSDCVKVFNLIERYKLKFEKNPEYYYEIRNLFNRDKKTHNYIQAARFIFLIHSNYNGMYRLNKSGNYNVPIGKLKPSLPNLEQLKLIQEKIKKTTIMSFDYKEIITLVSKNDFIYIDPPYPPFDWENPQNQYTVINFKKEDHISIANFANDLRKSECFVLISYPDTTFIRNLYKDWEIITLDTIRSISGKKERKKISEVLIKNYK